MNLEQIKKRLESGFFGFWIRKARVSFLLILLIVIMGVTSLISIPKESSPDITFGIASIGTVYTGATPTDVDKLITQKIEQEIEDIDGLKKISSSSRLGFSSIIVEFDTGVDIPTKLQEVRDGVDKAKLPLDAEDPSVEEISVIETQMFSVYVYGDESVSQSLLQSKAKKLADELETISGVSSVDIGWWDDFDIEIILDKNEMEARGISLDDISNLLRDYNSNAPLGSYVIDDKRYDFRFEGEFEDVYDILETPVIINDSSIPLSRLAIIQRTWNNDALQTLGGAGIEDKAYITLQVNKKKGTSIFRTSAAAKAYVDTRMQDFEFANFGHLYGRDSAEEIILDYKDLGKNARTTFILVFLSLFVFIGVKAAIISTLALMLAFLTTFFVLNSAGLTLNFLTNFSLVLTFGIAIDTTIVIVEAAFEKLQLGYNKRHAILLAVRDYKAPVIIGTVTTLFAFLPMLVLPGVMGKFLSYIPITIFVTLLATLVYALTLNTVLFVFLNKKPTHYSKYEHEHIFIEDDKKLLAEDRKGKTEAHDTDLGMRRRLLFAIDEWYGNIMERFLGSRKLRWISILAPIICLFISFILLSPRIGFSLFPSSDTQFLNMQIRADSGVTREYLEQYEPRISEVLQSVPEIRFFAVRVQDTDIDITVETYRKSQRKEGFRNTFDVEKAILKDFAFLRSDGLVTESIIEADGPPGVKPVGVKLIAQNTRQFPTLVEVSNDFEDHLKTIEGVKNVTNSSEKSPGQFVFELQDNVLFEHNISATQIRGALTNIISGANAGTIRLDGDDRDIVLLYDSFVDEVRPSELLNTKISTPEGQVPLSKFLDYTVGTAVTSIDREDTKLLVSVGADIEQGKVPSALQAEFVKFAESYNFPEGISYTAGGENAENAELLMATLVGFVVAVILIFSVLVLQFDSFRQPFIILYSVILAMLGVNIGLWVTGNPYSMPFAIGFIALTGVVVNDAIILIDRMNKVRATGLLSPVQVLVDAGKTRLQPVVLTTLTTVAGVLPLAFQDEFWAGLGFTIIFGLSFASAMTLFVVPSLYYMLCFDLHTVRDWFRGVWKKIRRKK